MYQLTRDAKIIRRLSDGAYIPVDEKNADYREYLRWRDGWTENPEDGAPIVHPPHAPVAADPAPPPTQDELDIVSARQYAKLRALRDLTPEQIGAWVDANVTDLAKARDVIRTLAIAVGVLARRL